METWRLPKRTETRFDRRGKRLRVVSLSFGALLLSMAAPEFGLLQWTPVRGSMKPAPEQVSPSAPRMQFRTTASTAATFATPWIVPDPPPLLDPTHSGQGITITTSGNSWVTVCADGRKVFERLFEPGTEVRIPFSREATLRSGNAGALTIEVAGQAVGLMGPWGAIRMIKATPRGFEFVTPVISSGCAAS